MNNLKSITFIFFFFLLVFGCTNESENVISENVVAPQSEFKTYTPNIISSNPNRGYYDVVVIDDDRWEICLNMDRNRTDIISYTGHLWYQMGSFIFEGEATAMYDPRLDLLTVTALDAGWDRGHIVYSLEFDSEASNDMTGAFVYFEFSRRVNLIDAWLVQGQLGPHDAGTVLAKTQRLEPWPDIHPKKERYELENN